ncbi:hypothetical protein PEPS_08220 [Persicobacter psychrovividus]|uniref:Uncharacterized protein n=2 Tax=Persicobacter psychrovividus TaxID=387638 RepID=A0ABM7VC78_9BACT|nr:hypothetical protein PEPS_08220 [Persicobacter psychrovividus]
MKFFHLLIILFSTMTVFANNQEEATPKHEPLYVQWSEKYSPPFYEEGAKVINYVGWEQSFEDLQKEMNALLNIRHRINMNKIFLIVKGSEEFIRTIEAGINTDLFAQVILLTDDPVKEELAHTVMPLETSREDILAECERHYNWDVKLSNIREKYTRPQDGAGFKGLNVGLNQQFQTSVTKEAGPRYFGSYEFGYSELYPSGWMWMLSYDARFKLPNMEKIMQEEMKGQMDPSDMMGGGRVTITLQREIPLVIHNQINVSVRKYLPWKEKQTYLQGGLAFQSYMGGIIEMDTSFTVSGGMGGGMPSGGMGGGGGFGPGGGGFGGDIEGEGMSGSITSIGETSLLLEAGCTFPFFDASKLDAYVKYQVPISLFDKNRQHYFNQFVVGFRYRFEWVPKKKQTVDYLRLKR